MRVLNGGTMVERTINVDLIERGPGALDAMLAAIVQACEGLEDVSFQTEAEVYNYGDSVTSELHVYGTPVGELADQARALYLEQQRR